VEVGAICQRPVFTIRPYELVSRAAQLMAEHQVGYLVVVEFGPYARPVGVLSERDIVVRVLARGMDPKAVCVRDIMTADPTLARESDFVEAALPKMRESGVRRLPVVNDHRELVGLLTLEDVLRVSADDRVQDRDVTDDSWQIEDVIPV
jgi:CBS domain-containing protein